MIYKFPFSTIDNKIFFLCVPQRHDFVIFPPPNKLSPIILRNLKMWQIYNHSRRHPFFHWKNVENVHAPFPPNPSTLAKKTINYLIVLNPDRDNWSRDVIPIYFSLVPPLRHHFALSHRPVVPSSSSSGSSSYFYFS